MKEQVFDRQWRDFVSESQGLVQQKGRDYAGDDDRWANFKERDGCFIGRVDVSDFLFKDEVDKQYIKPGSEWYPTVVGDLLKRRWNADKAITLATNWTCDDLAKPLGRGTESVITRHVEVLEIDGDDINKEAQRQRLAQGVAGLRDHEDMVRTALSWGAMARSQVSDHRPHDDHGDSVPSGDGDSKPTENKEVIA